MGESGHSNGDERPPESRFDEKATGPPVEEHTSAESVLPGADPQPPRPDVAPVNILLVDDRPENLLALKAILDAPDRRLFTAATGEDALHIALREELAVILLDVLMPGMDGFEVATHLKKTRRTQSIPILFLTAFANDIQQIYRAYSVGAVDYLTKPLDAEVVRRKIAVFIDMYRQHKEIERQAKLLREAERKEFEIRLAGMRVASDERYRKLVEGIDHTLAWSADTEPLRMSFVSRQADHLLGYPRERLAEPDFWQSAVHPADRDRVLAAFHRALGTDGDQFVDHRMLDAEGRTRWFHTGVSVERRPSGPAELHGMSVDVTDLKRSEEAQRLLARVAATVLAESLDWRTALGKLAGLLVPTLGDWCLITEVGEDDSLRLLEVAHADRAEQALTRECVPVRTQLDDEFGVGALLRTGMASLQATVPDPAWLATAIGTPRVDVVRRLGGRSALFVPVPRRGRSFALITLVSTQLGRTYDAADLGLATRIGEQAGLAVDNAMLYAQAQAATEVRDELLAIVSHDLRSPLTAITTSASLAQKLLTREATEETRARLAKTLPTILRSAERMNRLIVDLLDLASIRAARLKVERRPVEVAGLIEDTLEGFRVIAEEKGVQLAGETEHDEQVNCDRDRVLQILANLVGNAIKFTPGGGSVTLRAQVSRHEMVFAVQDTGPGIPADKLPHLFERFWQDDTHQQRGVGLGLSIAKGLTEAHGGRIWVESTPGVGTIFRFTLPLVVEERTSAPTERHPAP